MAIRTRRPDLNRESGRYRWIVLLSLTLTDRQPNAGNGSRRGLVHECGNHVEEVVPFKFFSPYLSFKVRSGRSPRILWVCNDYSSVFKSNKSPFKPRRPRQVGRDRSSKIPSSRPESRNDAWAIDSTSYVSFRQSAL